MLEFTSFSARRFKKETYESAIRAYLAKMGVTDFEIEDIEQGCIPMTTQVFERFTSQGAIQIGTAAGSVKPGTGYAFMRIHEDVRRVADSILLGSSLPAVRRGRFNWYDSLLLHIIQNEEKRAVSVFERLFKRVKIGLILRFLDEKTSIWQEIKLFARLPILLFLRTALARL